MYNLLEETIKKILNEKEVNFDYYLKSNTAGVGESFGLKIKDTNTGLSKIVNVFVVESIKTEKAHLIITDGIKQAPVILFHRYGYVDDVKISCKPYLEEIINKSISLLTKNINNYLQDRIPTDL